MLPIDFYRNPKEYEKLSYNVKRLLDKDVYCSVMVEVINSKLNENDIIFRIVGIY